MASVNETNRKIDLTVRVFDEFYSFAEDVPAQEYDAVLSFFKTKFTDTVAAENFTTALFRVATQSQTSIMNLLQELQDKNQLELTATLCYYLNGLRSPTTLLGINTTVTPNFYAARNVLP